MLIQGGVIAVAAVVSIVSYAFLIPLDSVPAVTGVSIIIGIAYSNTTNSPLTWLNTHLMFLIVIPATIGATAMNVTAIQNTRNLLAGQITN